MGDIYWGKYTGEEWGQTLMDTPIEDVSVSVWADEYLDLQGLTLRGNSVDMTAVSTTPTVISDYSMFSVEGTTSATFSVTIHVQWGEDAFDLHLTSSEDTAPDEGVNVRIYRDSEDWMDASLLLVEGGLPVVSMVENRPGMATFTLLNDYETEGACLVSDCTLWKSRAPVPIACGMFVEIRDRKGGAILMDGFITTITARAEVVAVEIGDGNAILGRQGTWIRRNYYGSTAGFRWFDTALDDEGQPYIEVGQVDGTIDTTQVSWMQASTTDVAWPESSPDVTTVRLDDLQAIRLPAVSGQYVRYLGLRIASGSSIAVDASIGITVKVNGAEYLSTVWQGTLQGTNTGGYTEVPILDLSTPVERKGIEIALDPTVDGVIRIDTTQSGEVVTASGTIAGLPSCVLVTEVENRVTVSPDSTSGRIYPTTVYDWMTAGPSQARIYVSSGGLPVTDVMANVMRALGSSATVRGSCASEVDIARVGGGYALDYLQAMAEVPDSTGGRRAFICRGRGQFLRIGDRYRVTDDPRLHIIWERDRTSSDQMAFSSFDPCITLKNRPSLVTVRATGDLAQPILATVEDVASSIRRGLVVESIASTTTVASDADAVRTAYGELTSSELDAWEGTVTLPGIVQGLLETEGDHAGSGVPLVVTDTRNGLRDVRVRVRQVRYDYNAMTTAATVGNLDSSVVNKIADTIAMAQKGNAEAFAAASTASAYATQYLRARYSGITVQDENSVTITVATDSGSVSVPVTEITAGILPDGTAILQGRVTSEVDGVEQYGVTRVSINGVSKRIPEEVRPDFMRGQVLVVSLTLTA